MATPTTGQLNRQRIEEILQKFNDGAGGLGRDESLRHAVRTLKAEVPYYTWVGIYLLEGNELVLHNFIGKPSPHTRIALNQGICGAAASSGETLIVPDVNADPRYLACSIETKSEIVVPIRAGRGIVGEIDIDSDQPDAFHAEDKRLLEALAARLGESF